MYVASRIQKSQGIASPLESLEETQPCWLLGFSSIFGLFISFYKIIKINFKIINLSYFKPLSNQAQHKYAVVCYGGRRKVSHSLTGASSELT